MKATHAPSLHVQTLGPDPGPGVDSFVLIHGFGASSFTWRYWAPRLAERGHVLLVDMKGHGRSPKPDDGRYGPEDHAQLVGRTLEERGLDRLTLVGHSLGGGVALLTALARADAPVARVERLVLVASAAYPQKLPPFVALAKRPRLMAAMFRVLGPRLLVRAVLKAIVYDPEKVDAEQVRGYALPLRSSDCVRALVATARQIQPPTLDAIAARFRTLRVPALLLWGRHDRVVPLAVGERLARELPNARLHVLETCGHVPPEELPDESYALLEAFLDEHPVQH